MKNGFFLHVLFSNLLRMKHEKEKQKQEFWNQMSIQVLFNAY